MRKALLVASLSTAAVLCAVGEGTEPMKDLVWGSRIEGLALSAKPERPEYKVGDEILTTVLVKNFGEKRADILTVGGRDESFRLELFDNKGRPVPKTERGRKADESASGVSGPDIPTRSVTQLDSAGESSTSIVLNRYFEIKKPGTYYLIVMRRLWTWEKGFLVSNMAHFRVVEK